MKRELFLILSILLLINPLVSLSQPSHSIALKYVKNEVSPKYIFPPVGGKVGSPSDVFIYKYYYREPAPMGIADYGIGPKGAYEINTTQFLGEIDINSLRAISNLTPNNPCVAFQLNVVLNYQSQGDTYAIWVQDVAVYNTMNRSIFFVDNIWNFTKYLANVSGVIGNGETAYVKLYDRNVSFYYYCAFNYPGSNVTLTLPAKLYLLVNVTTNSLGQPVILLWYNDGYGWVNYDKVTITTAENAKNVYFLINGYQYTGYGNFYDAELEVTGPGNGSCAYILNSSIHLSLEYWNGHNFEEIKNAYNFGSDTGETSNNVITNVYYNSFSGNLASELLAGKGSLGTLWTQNSVTTLIINASIPMGYALVYNSSYPYNEAERYESALGIPFYNGQIELTLFPMNYSVVIYSVNGSLVGEASVIAEKGETITTGVTQFNLSAPTMVTSYLYRQTQVNIEIHAYGQVKLNLIIPEGINYTFNKSLQVKGEITDVLTLCPSEISPGNYTIIINASIFTGFYQVIKLTLNVVRPTYEIYVIYKVLGQPPPQSPQLILHFPNGSVATIGLSPYTSIEIPAGTTYTIQNVIGGLNGVRWITNNPTSGIIKLPENISLIYIEQDLVTFTYKVVGGSGSEYGPPIVSYYYFGNLTSVQAPATVWVDYNSTFNYPQFLPGSNSEERWIAMNYTGRILFPTTIGVVYFTQYYVNLYSPIPIYALINGTNSTLSSGWYYGGTKIVVENITYYYLSQLEREVIVYISPKSITLEAPVTIIVKTIVQYYVYVNSKIPVHAIVNGKNETLTSGWFNSNTSIQIENITYYISPLQREVITSVYPSESLIVTSPEVIIVTNITQYYVNITSPIPVKAIIDGKNVILNSTWMDSGINITILNYTYYANSTERFIIVKVYPSSQIFVNNPIHVVLYTVKQYLVTINGISNWYNEGSKIYLKANVPFYEVGRFVGTYNVSPNSAVIVDQPINETLMKSPNFLAIGLILAIVIVVSAIILLITRKRRR